MREFEELATEYEKRALACLSEADIATSASDRKRQETFALELLRLAADARALCD
jgi:hypothetical protein